MQILLQQWKKSMKSPLNILKIETILHWFIKVSLNQHFMAHNIKHQYIMSSNTKMDQNCHLICGSLKDFVKN
jgi:hypothetical protein